MKAATALTVLALLAAPTLRAQTPLAHVPESRLARLAKGIDVSFWDLNETKKFGVSQSDLTLIRNCGFRHVRLYVYIDQLQPTAPPDVVREAFAWLDYAVDLVLANDLGLMLALLSDFNGARFREPGAIDAFDALWHVVATRYRSRDPERLYFELYSEPGAAGIKEAEWEEWQLRFASTVRAAAPEHTIVATSAGYSKLPTFPSLTPLEDRNVVYAFHFYPPTLGTFVFQGYDEAYFIDPVLLNLRDLPYPSHLPEATEFVAAVADPETRAMVERYVADRWWSGHIDRLVGVCAAWSKAHGRPVILNEFNLASATNAPPESRQRYVRDVRRAAEKWGIGWTAFNYTGNKWSLTQVEGETRVPDPGVLAALGLTTWAGADIPPPVFAFDGPDVLSADPVVLGDAGISSTTAGTDLDGDGFPEVIAIPGSSPDASARGAILLKNHFGGGVTDATAELVSSEVPGTVQCSRIVTADLNRDSRPDLLFADYGFPPSGAQNRLLLSGADGRYVDASATLPQQAVLTTSADAADTRGNGLVDVVLLIDDGREKARMQLLANDGSGHFTVDNTRLPAALTDTARYDNIFADGRFITNHGAAVPDLVLIGWGAIPSVYLRNDGTGRFTLGPTLPPKPFGGKANEVAMAAADLNMDGAVDLVVGYLDEHWDGGFVQVLMGNGNGTFRDETAQRIVQPDFQAAIASLSFSPATAKSRAYLLIGTGGGGSILKALDTRYRFVDEPVDALGEAFTPSILVDFNADGLTDIFTPATARALYGVERVNPHRVRRQLRPGA